MNLKAFYSFDNVVAIEIMNELNDFTLYQHHVTQRILQMLLEGNIASKLISHQEDDARACVSAV